MVDDAIQKHNSLILEGMKFFVPVICLALPHAWVADLSDSAVNEAPDSR